MVILHISNPTPLVIRNLRTERLYDEICKYFAEGKQRDVNTNEVQKQLKLHDLSIKEYLTNKYA